MNAESLESDAGHSHRLIVDGLAMRFGRRRLFQGLSFTVAPGGPVAIVGPNGSGKSTLLRLIAGVLAPSSGTVTLQENGAAVPDVLRPHRVGMVAPYLELYEPLTARENLSFLARARRLPAGRVAEVLEAVGLAERADEPLSTYSTGMRQRVRVAAARLHDPPLLLLDEPGASLDAAGRDLVRSLLDPTKLVVLATNDEREAEWCSERVLLGGRLGVDS
jgi:heme exporter protein A